MSTSRYSNNENRIKDPSFCLFFAQRMSGLFYEFLCFTFTTQRERVGEKTLCIEENTAFFCRIDRGFPLAHNTNNMLFSSEIYYSNSSIVVHEHSSYNVQ